MQENDSKFTLKEKKNEFFGCGSRRDQGRREALAELLVTWTPFVKRIGENGVEWSRVCGWRQFCWRKRLSFVEVV